MFDYIRQNNGTLDNEAYISKNSLKSFFSKILMCFYSVSDFIICELTQTHISISNTISLHSEHSLC